MDNVKYTPVIGKYTRTQARRSRPAVRMPRRRADVVEGLGAAGTFALYFAVLLWAIMGAVR